MWKKLDQDWPWSHNGILMAEAGVQLKSVQSKTGPGPILGKALWKTGDSLNEVKLLWKDPIKRGWVPKVAYRWQLLHRPNIGLIRLKISDGVNFAMDSGNIFDSTLKGGKLGVFCFSQEKIIWSDLEYRYQIRQNQLVCHFFLRDVSFIWLTLFHCSILKVQWQGTRSDL